MTHVPVVELAIRGLGESVHAAVAMHHEEVEVLVLRGVERAIATIGESIIEEAARLAAQKTHEDVKHYLLYGEGGKAIRAAVIYALEPLTAILQAPPVPGGDAT